MIRRTYDWVLSWAEHPAGVIALAILAFAESSFFPIPPDVLLIALAMGKPARSFWFATVCTVASVVGALFGYLIGNVFWHAVSPFFFTYVPGFTAHQFTYVQNLYEQYNFWIVFTAAFTPIPYKVITVSAGVFDINLPMFVVASLAGRTGRFFLVGALIWKFGPPIKAFIDKYLNLLAVVFTILIAAGFVAIKYAF
jgi:membrane protein YqaA with SNARE-associated domain